MIVGTIALIALLFGGGINEIFFVDQLEKGVKVYVVDKERKKDILDDMKASKAFIKEFNKKRDARKKEFDQLNSSYSTTLESFDAFFVDVLNSRVEFQEKIIDDRINILKMIEPAEWDSIIAYSKLETDDRIEKEEEKEKKVIEKGKEKEVFGKTKAAIKENILPIENQEAVLRGLNEMIIALDEVGIQIASINVLNNDVIINKNASKEDMLNLLGEINALREVAIERLVSIHMLVKANSSEIQFDPIMKTFNKELSIKI